MRKIEVFAPNISHGGGKILLEQLLDALINLNLLKKAYVSYNLYNHAQKYDIDLFKFYKSNIIHRLYSQYEIHNSVEVNRKIIFFGNWPPFMKVNGTSILYLHNKLLLTDNSKLGLSKLLKIKLSLHKKIIKLFKHNLNVIYVQTREMKELADFVLNPVKVELKPFVSPKVLNQKNKKEYDFIYSSYGYAYKNHGLLLKAWVLLAKENIFPSLFLTLDSKMDNVLIDRIENLKKSFDLKIDIGKDLKNDDVYNVYAKSNALIWPSFIESFGLPLIEAAVNELDIISANLPYVYDILEPSLVFDPNDEKDLVNTIKNYLLKNEHKIKKSKLNIKIDSADAFIKSIKWNY